MRPRRTGHSAARRSRTSAWPPCGTTRPLGGGLIAPAPKGGVWNLSNYRKRVWRPALQAAGVEYRALDNTRHTYATLAITARIPVEWVSKQMGHTNIQTTLKHYARWLPVADDHYIAAFDAHGSTDGRNTRRPRLY
jgi:integrase